MKKIIILILILIIISIIAIFLFYKPKKASTPKKQITSFDECIKAGNPVMESYPRQCRSDEKTFIEDIGNELEKIDLIRIDSPRPNQEITSPLKIRGQARGTWFFEGDFPISLVDKEGNILANHYATAQEEWMTEKFIPFTSTLEFEATDNTEVNLILKKDNPSGLPEHDDELIVPLKKKPQ